IEFRLYKDGVQLPTYTNLPPPFTISAGECAQQSSLAWNPAPFTLPALKGGSEYLLEKRIITHNRNAATQEYYVDEHSNSIRTHYESQLASAFAPLNTYLD